MKAARLLGSTASNSSRLQSTRRIYKGNYHRLHTPSLSYLQPHVMLRDEKRREDRSFHTTTRNDSAVAIGLSLGAVSAASYAAATGLKAYREWQESRPPPEEVTEEVKEEEKDEQKSKDAKSEESGDRQNVFAKWFGVGVGSKYYEGGFEETMTRREAALILGVRESSSPARVKEAHRKLLILNHPDTGGSTYMAGKINEAKELLLKGKRM